MKPNNFLNFIDKFRLKIKLSKNLGFTLIELLVVISIIGFLATSAMVLLNSARVKARDARRQADLVQIRKAIEMYFVDNSVYPQCGGGDVCSTTGYAGSISSLAIVPNYMAKTPLDPTNVDTAYGYYYARGYKKTGTVSFIYSTLATDYILATRLEGVAGTFGAWNNGNLNLLLGN